MVISTALLKVAQIVAIVQMVTELTYHAFNCGHTVLCCVGICACESGWGGLQCQEGKIYCVIWFWYEQRCFL